MLCFGKRKSLRENELQFGMMISHFTRYSVTILDIEMLSLSLSLSLSFLVTDRDQFRTSLLSHYEIPYGKGKSSEKRSIETNKLHKSTYAYGCFNRTASF